MKTIVLLTLITLFSCGDKVNSSKDENVVDESIYDEKGALKTDLVLINQGKFSHEKLIANIGLGLVIPTTEEFKDHSLELQEELNQYCEQMNIKKKIDSLEINVLRRGIQQAWKRAMQTYHRLELFRFGAANEASSNFYQAVYTHHYSSKCLVDRRVLLMSSRNRLPNLAQIDNFQERGLDALEPLFFDDINNSRCRRVNARLQVWFDKSPVQRQQDICRYSKHLVKDIVYQAETLSDQWALNKGNYLTEILRNEKLGTHIQALNKISTALFQLDILKAKKLAYPAGLEVKVDQQVIQCAQASCPGKTEHLYAKFSIESLISNVKAFKDLFQGKDGFGFDDFLKEEGYQELVTKFEKSIEAALESLNLALGKTTVEILTTDIDRSQCEATSTTHRKVEACALLADIKIVTDLLKNEYLLALKELSAPKETQGDLD